MLSSMLVRVEEKAGGGAYVAWGRSSKQEELRGGRRGRRKEKTDERDYFFSKLGTGESRPKSFFSPKIRFGFVKSEHKI